MKKGTQIYSVAVWSLGQHALRNIIPAIVRANGVELVGAFSRNQDKTKDLSEELDVKAYSSSSEMLADSDVDIVYLSSPNSEHYDQIVSCLEAGKSVLCEKAACINAEEAERVVSLAESKGLIVMEAFMYRFHQQFKDLAHLLESKKYGSLNSLRAQFGFPHLKDGDIRYDSKLAGGALNDAGAYTLSLVRQILGNDVIVKGAVGTSMGFDVDVSGSALLCDHGESVFAQCSWAFGASYINEVELWCENARIVVERAFSKPESFDPSISVFQNGQCVETINSGPFNHFIAMLEHLANNLSENEASQEHLQLQAQAQLLECVRRAIRLG